MPEDDEKHQEEDPTSIGVEGVNRKFSVNKDADEQQRINPNNVVQHRTDETWYEKGEHSLPVHPVPIKG